MFVGPLIIIFISLNGQIQTDNFSQFETTEKV